jgi:hypothetical protein
MCSPRRSARLMFSNRRVSPESRLRPATPPLPPPPRLEVWRQIKGESDFPTVRRAADQKASETRTCGQPRSRRGRNGAKSFGARGLGAVDCHAARMSQFRKSSQTPRQLQQSAREGLPACEQTEGRGGRACKRIARRDRSKFRIDSWSARSVALRYVLVC